MVLFGTRGPSLFQVIREGTGWTGRLHDRGALRLANRLRLALEPGCFENHTATAPEKIRGMERTRSEALKLFVCFRYWASKFTPFFHTTSTIVAMFLANVRRAISGCMPLASNAV